MYKISKDNATKYYKKMLDIHNSGYLILEEKVSILFRNLEHEILKEITKKDEFFEQWNYLKNNQTSKQRNFNNNNLIPPTLLSDLHSFKPWRNEAVHKSTTSIDDLTYLKLFNTMAKTIEYFSEELIPNELNNIYNKNTNIKKYFPEKNIVKKNKKQKEKNVGKMNNNTEKNYNDVYITTDDLKNISIAAYPLPEYEGESGVRKTNIPLKNLFADQSISSIELTPRVDSSIDFEGAYIHYSRKENEWWIKKRNSESREYREYVKLFLDNEQLK